MTSINLYLPQHSC